MNHALETAELQELTATMVEQQAEACVLLGSHLYAALMRAAAADVRGDGVTWDILRPHASADRGSAITLRFLAAVHRLVLQGRAPAVAAHYPSVGGSGAIDGAWDAFHATLLEHRDELIDLVGWSCQTNEVGRSAGLMAGFLVAAQRSGLPLRLLEIGASAGLQLRWDKFRYEWDAQPEQTNWGPPVSPVRLSGHWDLPAELLGTEVQVASRQGCDPNPVDVTTEEGRLRLRQSIWGDQPARFARLNGALELAALVPAQVDQVGAGAWLAEQLAEPTPGVLTVVYHSVVWQYLPEAERDEVRRLLYAAGARASAHAPLAWVRSEPENILRAMRVRLTMWPGGEERLVAKAGAHGFPVRWQPALSTDR